MCTLAGAPENVATFVSPIDLSGGGIVCTYQADTTEPWEGRFVKASVRYARLLLRLAELVP